jgi:VWFA-related protein
MRFAQESNSEDETFIVSFSDYPTLSQDFTSNSNELERSLRDISPHGSTALYDAVAYAADHMRNATRDKKVLLVVTDGEDNNSRLALKDVLEQLKESNMIVYTIGLLSYEGILGSDSSGRAKKALKEMAEVTGGQVYFPRSVKDVDGLCRRVARDLRNQYTIGYRPTNESLDGSWRAIHVQVFPPKGTPSLRVRTKRGYYAPSAVRSSAEVTPRRP